MRARVAECVVRTGPLRRKQRVRVDLHGVSVFGPARRHHVVRWEWIDKIEALGDRMVIRCSSRGDLEVPAGAFASTPADLARRLEQARALVRRPEVIAELVGDAGGKAGCDEGPPDQSGSGRS